MRKLLCWIKAIPFWIRTGLFVPHEFDEGTYERAIIIATDKGFRVSDNYQHEPMEEVYKDAVLVKYRCIHCGHEERAWYSSYEVMKQMEA